MAGKKISKSGAVVKPRYWKEEIEYKGQVYALEVVTENLKMAAILFNMQSAHDCFSRAKGYCQLTDPDQCYAFVSERAFPPVLPCRRRQELLWDKVPAPLIAKAFIRMLSKGKRIQYLIDHSPLGFVRIRFNESGDIKSQSHLIKLAKIAKALVEFFASKGVRALVAGYSANIELKETTFTRQWLVMKGSGNDYFNGRCDAFTGTKPAGSFLCRGDRRTCAACCVPGLNIAIPIH